MVPRSAGKVPYYPRHHPQGLIKELRKCDFRPIQKFFQGEKEKDKERSTEVSHEFAPRTHDACTIVHPIAPVRAYKLKRRNKQSLGT